MKKKIIILISAILIIAIAMISFLVIKSEKKPPSASSNNNDNTTMPAVKSTSELNSGSNIQSETQNDKSKEKKEDVSNDEYINKSSTNNVKVSSKDSNNITSNNSNDNQTNSQSDNTTNSNVVESKKEEKQVTSSQNNYIGVPDPNSPYYSYHHGKIEYSTMDQCLNSSEEISLKDTTDILNTICIDVVDSEGTILGEYLYINCKSGDCNKYK